MTADVTATIGSLANRLATGSPAGAHPLTLRVQFPDRPQARLLNPSATVHESSLRSGCRVEVVPVTERRRGDDVEDAPAAVVQVLSGPEAGHEYTLSRGVNLIGRDAMAQVYLAGDDEVSRRHASVTVGETIEVVDLNSANGVAVDGRLVARAFVDPSTVVQVGESRLRIVPLASSALTASTGTADTTSEFSRSPRVDPAYRGRSFTLPEIPVPGEEPRLPVIAIIAPIVLGAVLFLVTKQPYTLVFIALSPVIMIGTWIDYLRDATSESPRVQLYLYDPDKSRIIEMIGTFGPGTTNVVTYTPGTFADLDGFYSGQTQAMAEWLASRHSDTVAFVYKDGMYPGETNPESTMNLLRIGEANDPSVARDAGQRLADFQRRLNAGTDIARDARSTAIGHSWGLANVTSSEVEGAHYDTVVSLAGAGMPSQWEPSPTTKYVHEGYPDLLLEAQLTGKVWDGRIPLLEGSFEIHMHQGLKPVVDIHSVLGVEVKTLDQQALLDNYNLVAEASKSNREVLNEINRTIYGDR